ncbi:hypothetical protein ASF28_09015 [Methylobacterium sp. Leaf99]|uniref:hypothetical protein n=1 Tax=Methylobacterium sp. Leaf99 TaxID=1736251 RepID=UPI0006F4D21B|nr:hypothetical protein [Methylobacterium sp. Leaf99]KQP11174.1 hypothetical protein ASF28_09015 [Methylobacterium sp. Leaf99]
MSAQAIATEMRAELRQFRRRTRYGDQAQWLEAKDSHCAMMERLLADLMRAIGTPALLSMAPGHRTLGRRSVQVVIRDRVPAKRTAARA